MSLRWSTGWARNCSGLIYSGVPRAPPGRVAAEVVHGVDVRMLDPPSHLDLVVETPHRLRVTSQVHELERHHGVEGPVVSLEDRTHTTFAKVGQDFVAVGNERADGREQGLPASRAGPRGRIGNSLAGGAVHSEAPALGAQETE